MADDLARAAMLHRLAALTEPPGAGASIATGGVGSWRPVDDDLAVLVYDSRFDPQLLAAVRSSGTVHRQLTFESRHLLLELDVADGTPFQVTCQVVPSQRARLSVRHRSGTLDIGEDGHGSFHIPRLPDGPVSLRCVPLADGVEPVATSWLAF